MVVKVGFRPKMNMGNTVSCNHLIKTLSIFQTQISKEQEKLKNHGIISFCYFTYRIFQAYHIKVSVCKAI